MALKLFAGAGTSFLIGFLGVALSGGGLSRGTLPDPLNTMVAVVTWLALLAALPLLVAAGVTGIVSVVQPQPARRSRGRRSVSPPRRDISIVGVLLVLTTGAIGLLLATRTPSPDQVPFGLGLLALAVVALAVVLWDRFARFSRR